MMPSYRQAVARPTLDDGEMGWRKDKPWAMLRIDTFVWEEFRVITSDEPVEQNGTRFEEKLRRNPDQDAETAHVILTTIQHSCGPIEAPFLHLAELNAGQRCATGNCSMGMGAQEMRHPDGIGDRETLSTAESIDFFPLFPQHHHFIPRIQDRS